MLHCLLLLLFLHDVSETSIVKRQEALYWLRLILNPVFLKCFMGCLTHTHTHTQMVSYNGFLHKFLQPRKLLISVGSNLLLKDLRAEVKRRHWCQ